MFWCSCGKAARAGAGPVAGERTNQKRYIAYIDPSLAGKDSGASWSDPKSQKVGDKQGFIILSEEVKDKYEFALPNVAAAKGAFGEGTCDAEGSFAGH